MNARMQLTEKTITPRCKIQEGSQARLKHTSKLTEQERKNTSFFYCHVKKTTIEKYNNNSVISSNHITLQYHYSIIDHFFLYVSNRLYF